MTHCYTQFLYRLYAPIYDVCLGRLFRDGHSKAVACLSKDVVNVLDIGVGTGLSLPCYRASHEVTGIDTSEAMLARARKRLKEEGLENVSLVRMDAECLEFPDESFDAVMLCYVLSVFVAPEKVLGEACRVCKAGGSLVVVNHSVATKGIVRAMERLFAPLAKVLGFRSSLDVRKLLIETAGLELAETEGANAFRYWDVYHCKRRVG